MKKTILAFFAIIIAIFQSTAWAGVNTGSFDIVFTGNMNGEITPRKL